MIRYSLFDPSKSIPRAPGHYLGAIRDGAYQIWVAPLDRST
jgi:hypothetical protein